MAYAPLTFPIQLFMMDLKPTWSLITNLNAGRWLSRVIDISIMICLCSRFLNKHLFHYKYLENSLGTVFSREVAISKWWWTCNWIVVCLFLVLANGDYFKVVTIEQAPSDQKQKETNYQQPIGHRFELASLLMQVLYIQASYEPDKDMKGKAFCRRFRCRVPQDAIEGIGKICVILLAASCHWLQQEYCRVLWLLQCCHSTEQVWVESKSYLQHLELVDMLLIYNAKVLILDLCIMNWHRNLFWGHKSVYCKILHVTIRLKWLANLNCV